MQSFATQLANAITDELWERGVAYGVQGDINAMVTKIKMDTIDILSSCPTKYPGKRKGRCNQCRDDFHRSATWGQGTNSEVVVWIVMV